MNNIKTRILSLSVLVFLFGCSSNNKSETPGHGDVSSTVQTQQNETIEVKDKYVGDWVDINRAPDDTSEIFSIAKLHDFEYQLGPLTGELKEVDKSGVKKAEYLSIWSNEHGVEIQFIFDDYTKHLLMRTPIFSKELRKIEKD